MGRWEYLTLEDVTLGLEMHGLLPATCSILGNLLKQSSAYFAIRLSLMGSADLWMKPVPMKPSNRRAQVRTARSFYGREVEAT